MAVSVIAYVVTFVPAHNLSKAGPILAIMPVTAIAWYYGARIGVLAGLVAFVTSSLLITFTNDTLSDVLFIPAAILGTGALAFIGFIVGKIRDLDGALRISQSDVAALNRLLEFEDLLAHLSTSFVAADTSDLETSTERALAAVGSFLGAERGFIRAFQPGMRPPKVLARWTIADAAPTLSGALFVAITREDWWSELIRDKRESIVIPSFDDLPPESGIDVEQIRSTGVKSYIAMPLVIDDQAIGVLTLSSRTREIDWSSTDVSSLEVAAQMFAAVAERRRSDEALQQSTRVLTAITQCNEALVRATDETDLIDELCRVIVEEAGFDMAWVGLVQDDPKGTVKKVALHGDDQGYVDSLDVCMAHVTPGQDPTCQAIQTGQPAYVAEVAVADEERWQVGAVAGDYQSILGLPLMASGETLGALTVYSKEMHVFDGDALLVLNQLADDMAFGIAALRSETQRREAEDRLRTLVHSKDQFVASVAHELRTPLAAVVGLSHELRDHPETFSRDETDELMDTIATQSSEVANIVDDLLVIARADIGKVRVEATAVDAEGVYSSVTAALTLAERARIVNEVHPATMWADPVRVRQIIRNLIANALRHGGEEVRLGVRSGATQVVMSVADSGPAIEGDRRDEMFEAYVGSARETMTASIGLGLAVARTLARLMGGDLSYHYEKGWSRFDLTLPTAPSGD